MTNTQHQPVVSSRIIPGISLGYVIPKAFEKSTTLYANGSGHILNGVSC